MFAIIETNGANKIIIGIPKDGADKSLPALAAMLEHNAVFLNQGWREAKIVKPKMTITLGDTYEAENDENPVIVAAPESGAVIGAEFEIATPDVFTSNAKAIAKREETIGKLNTEIQFLKQQLQTANEKLEALARVGADQAEGE